MLSSCPTHYFELGNSLFRVGRLVVLSRATRCDKLVKSMLWVEELIAMNIQSHYDTSIS